MTRILAIAFAATLCTTAAHANSSNVECNTIISALGVSTHVEGSADFETYKGKLPPDLAKNRAITAWQSKVETACPNYSKRWWRALARNVDCEGGMGKEVCTVSAAPAVKLFKFSWLLPK